MAAEPTDEIFSERNNNIDVETPLNYSIPSGDQSVWADVSSLLALTCKDLHDGELIHGDNFNLFAAMSALEIMDPKMDSGIVSTYYSVDEAIDNGAAPIPLSFDRTIDIQCIIDIMDHLLACEATWHRGQSLAQTVFSCIYLLRPDRTTSHTLLHSYFRVVRATCYVVVSAVSETRTNEEEDLFTMTYGLQLKGEGDEKCLSVLHAIEETISRQLRACKASSSKKRVLEVGIRAKMAIEGDGNGLRDEVQETGAPTLGDEALQQLEQCLARQFDLKFRRIEGCFEEIVDLLDAVGFDVHRNQNINGRPGVEARAEPIIDIHVPAHRQPVYDEDSEEEDEFGLNRYGRRQPFYGQRRRDANDERDNEDFRLRVDILFFNGSLNIEEFLNWIAEIDRFFDYLETPVEKRVRLVACRLKGGAYAWWERIQSRKKRESKGPVRT